MNNVKFFRNLFLILFTTPLFSQLSSDECLEQLSIFAESAKIKNYQAAYEPWKTVLDNCPTLSLATYQYGEIILKDFIKKSESSPPPPCKTQVFFDKCTILGIFSSGNG